MRGAFQSPLVLINQNIYKFLFTELRISWPQNIYLNLSVSPVVRIIIVVW